MLDYYTDTFYLSYKNRAVAIGWLPATLTRPIRGGAAVCSWSRVSWSRDPGNWLRRPTYLRINITLLSYSTAVYGRFHLVCLNLLNASAMCWSV